MKTLKSLLVVILVSLSLHIIEGSQYCTHDGGSYGDMFNNGRQAAFCTEMQIEPNKPLKLKDQVSSNTDVVYFHILNSTGSINKNALDLFPGVTYLIMGDSRISHFSLESNLIYFAVVNSTFPEVTSELLKGFGNLFRLSFDSNPGLEIETGAFKNLNLLTALELFNQTLPRLERKFFQGLTHLEYLDLIYSGLKHIDEDAFVDLPNLSFVRLDGNPIEVLPVNFSNSKELQSLTLIDTNLKTINTDIPKSLFGIGLPNHYLIHTDVNEMLAKFKTVRVIYVYYLEGKCPQMEPVLKQLKDEGKSVSNSSIHISRFTIPAGC